MKKKFSRGSLLIFVVLLTLVMAGCDWNSDLHQPIKASDVDHVMIWGFSANTEREATAEEVTKIVKWFNAADDIRENEDFAGTTPESGIQIKLKDGRQISIIRSGEDFEVQSHDSGGQSHSYWARQPQIKQWLDELAKPKTEN